MEGSVKNPSDFLRLVIGKSVHVKLGSNIDYKGRCFLYYILFEFFIFSGVLVCLDGYMNLVLENTEEYVNGELKNKYGDAFIRGNNGKWIFLYYVN